MTVPAPAATMPLPARLALDAPVTVPWIVVVCRGALVCLPPLAVYLFTIAGRHRRDRPVVVSAGADFLALLLGLSGFLTAGGLLALVAVQADARLVGGTFAQIEAAWGRGRLAWAAVAFIYIGGIAAAVAATLWARAGALAVYHADPAGVDAVVTESLAAAGVPAERFGNVWAADRNLAAVDHMPGLHHSTVRILTPDPRLTEELHRGLSLRLPDAPPARGDVAGGFAAAAGACAAAVCVAFGLLAYFEVIR